MQNEELVQHILDATQSVFSTMLGLEAVAGPARISQSGVGASHGVAALVGMAGTWIGTGSVDCSAAMACRIAGAMLGSEYPAVTDDVLDAMAEVGNMIIGNVKSSVEAVVGPMNLSIPTVVYGQNFTTRSQKRDQWTTVPFTCEGGEFLVQVMLVPNSQQAATAPSALLALETV